MIRVNLLPEEYRKVESTSLSLFLLFLLGVILVVLAFVGWLYLSVHGSSISNQLKEKNTLLAQVTNEANQAAKLEADLAEYDKRQTTIMAMRSGRIYWSRKLAQLVKDTKPSVWFIKILMKQKDAYELKPKEQPDPNRDGGYLELQCYQKTDNFGKLAEYRDRLLDDRLFFADFARIRPPEFQTVIWLPAVEEDRVTLSFKLVLYISPQYIYMD
jgi:hypothetical protein